MTKIFSVLIFFLINYYCRMERVDNICLMQNAKKVFLKLGEFGVLTAFNVTPVARSSNVSLQEGCKVDIVTCPSCIISLSFRLMNLSCYCGFGFNLFSRNPSRCDYVWVTEPPYNDASGMSFCRLVSTPGLREKSLKYRSKTKTVRIWFFYSRAYDHAFTMDYKSEPNRQLFFGTSQHSHEPNFSSGFISSPFFPVAYPQDLTAEYVLTCVRRSNYSLESDVSLDDDNNCRVYLRFTDFQLASSSVMEFFDGRRRVDVASGTSFRPPIMISTTNSLTIRFYASGQSNIGFKASFSFISEAVVKKVVKPIADCGGHVDDFGGTITMMKMVESHVGLFDCIWLIKPVKNLSVKSHLYLKVTTFLDFAGNAELQVRQGLTSESPLLENLCHPTSQNFQEHINSLQSGYYLSLKAFFGPASHFAVSYALFSHDKCFILPGFLCRNSRCISKNLICDGVDHCGDNSDESAICYQEKGFEPGIGREYTKASNYYFPNIKKYSVVKVASVEFLVSLVGSVFLMSALTVVLYRILSKSQRQRELQDELQSTDNFRDCLSDEVSIENIVIDDPPSYEPPPNYEEVAKMTLEELEISAKQQQ